MDTSTTLEEQIQALMDSLADTALSAAESRHQSQAGEAHLLYALYRNDGLVGSMLRGYGLESSEIRLLMSDIPNRPLKMEKTRYCLLPAVTYCTMPTTRWKCCATCNVIVMSNSCSAPMASNCPNINPLGSRSRRRQEPAST